MATTKTKNGTRLKSLEKCPTGIEGFDEITDGGLPKRRATLIAGGPGCGKTLFSAEFLIRGAVQYGEPGLFVAFEETAEELTDNVASLGFDLKRLVARKKVLVDYVRIERSEIQQTGEYDLEGLFIRLDYAIKSIGAKRVVLDTIEALFSGFPDPAILRAELRRLFRWFKDKGITVLITGERGEGTSITRQGLEEYVSDCVITLDHRVTDQMSTRRMRIVKYRGSSHGTNEYPFLIDEQGISVLPVTSLGLSHAAPLEKVSSGIPRLDEMLKGKGFYRGSTVLVSGTAGTGKTSVAASFADAACRRGEKVLFFAFEESQDQIIRNMRSIGIDLLPWVKKGLLRFSAMRSFRVGLESHLVAMHKAVKEFKPKAAVFDPATNFLAIGSDVEVKAMLTRLIDFLKLEGITAMFNSLTTDVGAVEQTKIGISSLMDTWILLQDVETHGERRRLLQLIKSRGMAHSNQVREFRMSDRGIDLADIHWTDGFAAGGK
jgi:circadian clock protein KaiC